MEITEVSNIFKMQQPPRRRFCQEERRVTDKVGFLAIIPVCMLCFALPAFLDLFLSDSDRKVINSTFSSTMNESSTNGTSANVSIRLIYDTFLSAINASINDKPLIHSFSCNAVTGLLSVVLPMGIFLFLIKLFLIRFVELYMSCISDYVYHFIIISAGKITSTTIFLSVTYFQLWNDAPRSQYRFMAYSIVAEFLLLCINILLYFSSKTYRDKNQIKNFKSTLRYYIRHRYLIILQFLNCVTMSLLLVYIGIKSYDFFPTFYPFTQMGIFFIIYLMHGYTKMVIILASASHSLEQDEQSITMQTVLSSMFIISRYHVGTLVLHVPFIRFILCSYCSMDDYISRPSVNSGSRIYFKSIFTCRVKQLIMFIAILGQAIPKAAKSLRYFEEKNQLLTKFENKTSAAWVDVLTVSLPYLLLNIYSETSISTSEEFIALIPIITSFVALIGAYFYIIICTMTTVENTNEFCKMITSEDIELIRKEEGIKATKSLERTIKNDTDQVFENQNNNMADNEKKFEISEKNII